MGIHRRTFYADYVLEDVLRITEPENIIEIWKFVQDDDKRRSGREIFTIIGRFPRRWFKYTPNDIPEFKNDVVSLQK